MLLVLLLSGDFPHVLCLKLTSSSDELGSGGLFNDMLSVRSHEPVIPGVLDAFIAVQVLYHP